MVGCGCGLVFVPIVVARGSRGVVGVVGGVGACCVCSVGLVIVDVGCVCADGLMIVDAGRGLAVVGGGSVCVFAVVLLSRLRMPGEMAVARSFDFKKRIASAGVPWFSM